MKLVFALVLIISAYVIINAKSSFKNNHKHKNGQNNFDVSPPRRLSQVKMAKPPKPIKTIPFGPAAKNVNNNINSLGEIVDKNVALYKFPFKITRCDQIVLFPANYINDEDDYRVRKPGFVAITAHYTNLFNAQDGQKLIEHILTSSMRGEPSYVQGARGCVRIYGGVRQKNINICTSSMKYAYNILEVYEDFARCRLGDNLSPIPPEVLRQLMLKCGISKVTIEGKGGAEAMNKLVQEVNSRNNRILSGETSKDSLAKQKADQAKRLLLQKFLKKKKKQPDFFLPSETNNAWETDRRRYVQYSRLKVPGTRR